MNGLPVCSGQDALRAFGRIGYELDRQTGSHFILRHPQMRRLTVPNHRELAKGTLRALIREAGLNVFLPEDATPDGPALVSGRQVRQLQEIRDRCRRKLGWNDGEVFDGCREIGGSFPFDLAIFGRKGAGKFVQGWACGQDRESGHLQYGEGTNHGTICRVGKTCSR